MAKPEGAKAAKLPIRKHLHYGDNLDVMRKMPGGIFDLTYLDPPFKSDLDITCYSLRTASRRTKRR